MPKNIPEYIVVPFQPQLEKGSKYGEIAVQVHSIISKYVSEGWEYVSVETIAATINLKLSQKESTSLQVMIFKR